MLRPGVTWEEARAEMDVIAARLAAEYPENKGFGVSVVPMRESICRRHSPAADDIARALGLIVLLVCVNVANLKLVRLEARRHEFAVRAALGASRARLIRQAVTESVLLALAAGALGFVLAPLCVRGLLAFVPPEQLPWLRVSTDCHHARWPRSVLASLITVLAGVLPALRGMRPDLSSALARGGRGAAARRRPAGDCVTRRLSSSWRCRSCWW